MPAFDAVTTTENGGVTSLSTSHSATGSNRYVLVGIFTNNEVGVTVAYGAQSCTLIAVTGEFNELRLFGLVAPNTGSQSVVATFDGTSSACAMGIISFTDVDQSTPTRDSDSTFLEGTSISLTLTSIVGDLIVDVAGGVTDAIAANGTQTERVSLDNFGEAFRSLGMSTKAGAATSTAMTWTAGSTALTQIAVSLISAGGGGGGPGPNVPLARKFGPQSYLRTLVNL